MIPTKEQIARLEAKEPLKTIRLIFSKSPEEHAHEAEYGYSGDTLTIVIEGDGISRADWSFCKDKVVWFYLEPEAAFRATIIWKKLLEPDNLPKMILTDMPDGLATYNPKTGQQKRFPHA